MSLNQCKSRLATHTQAPLAKVMGAHLRHTMGDRGSAVPKRVNLGSIRSKRTLRKDGDVRKWLRESTNAGERMGISPITFAISMMEQTSKSGWGGKLEG